MAVLRRLLRPCEQRFQFRHPREQPIDQLHLLSQQRVLLFLAQAVSKSRSHPYVESDSRRPRKRKIPKTANPASNYPLRARVARRRREGTQAVWVISPV
jgi:hypothetical protein